LPFALTLTHFGNQLLSVIILKNGMKKAASKKIRPLQKQKRPGLEINMTPVPDTSPLKYPAEGKLKNKVALITGGDSGQRDALSLLIDNAGTINAIVLLN